MRRKMIWLIPVVLLLCACGKDSAVQTDGSAFLEEEIKYVALTFDDGPRRATTTVLLDGLKARGAAATFFLVGEEIAGNEDIVSRMKEEGHQVGNHTWSHVRLENVSTDVMQEEISRTDHTIGDILGGSGYWLRPPYGLIREETEHLVEVPMIKWSVDPRDWESRDKEKVVAAVLDSVEDGSIILLHDIYSSSVEAALEIVDRLQADGYWFITVEELFSIRGIIPENGGLYSCA